MLCSQGGYIDNILKLKKASTYDYIQDNRFPRQRNIIDIIYFFKMFTVEVGSNVNLIHKMQLEGNLQFSWIMFNYMKRMFEWTLLTAHIYVLVY